MLSIILKTIIIFALVVIIIHLLLKKSLEDKIHIRLPQEKPNDLANTPSIEENESTVQVQETEQYTELYTAPVVQSTTNIIPPPPPPHQPHPIKTDDLFEFVYKNKKDEKNKQGKETETKIETEKDKAQIKGICEYEDVHTEIYCEY